MSQVSGTNENPVGGESAGIATRSNGIRHRPARFAWLAWLIWALSVLLLVSGELLAGPNSAAASAADAQSPGAGLVLLLALVCLMTVGAVVASRRPANPVGWIFSVVGLDLSLGGFAQNYAATALSTTPNSLPGGDIMAWIYNLASGPSLYGAFIFLVLLFPDGRLLTPRWRPIAWLSACTCILFLFVEMFSPGPFIRDFTQVVNPLGISALPGLRNLIEAPLFLLLLLLLLLAAASLVLRFRRSRGDERQQLKWLASAGALFSLIFAAGPILWLTPSFGNVVWPFLFALAMAAIPISTGIAILKYRLYDIDVIINRTLVYGTLTALLALVYWVSVALLQELLRTLTGQGGELAIVASTLAIAALFNPLRHRVQAFIDRRFYRRKYDAARTLGAFSATLRDEVELDALAGRLVQVVEETMQPAQVSLWLRAPESKAKRRI